MAEDRSLAARQQGGHLGSVGGGDRMPHEVDPAVELMETAASEATTDFRGAQPSRDELPSGDNAVLLARQLGDRAIWGVGEGLCVHMTLNPPLVVSAPRSATGVRRS